MNILSAFIDMLLGFAPFLGLVALITAALWIITMMFPEVGKWFETTMDRMFGVDAEYDEKHKTGYTSSTFDQYM